jgi:hypothetical protein
MVSDFFSFKNTTYLLLCHCGVRLVGLLEHLLLRVHWVGTSVHVGLAEVLLLRDVLRHAVVWRSHGVLCMDLRRHATRGDCRSRRLYRGVLATAALVGMGLLARDNVNEEVKHVRLGQRRRNVGPLEGATLVLFGVDPGAHGELCDEDVAALREQDGRLRRDHLDLGVCLHHLLDARQRQLVQLVVMFVRLELGNLLLPVRVEDVAVVSREALVDLPLISAPVSAFSAVASYILPRAGEQLWVGRVALGGNLDQISVDSNSAGAQRTYGCRCACERKSA